MRKVDKEALHRAIQMAKADPAQRRWIIEKIRDEGWEEAGLSAAYHYQIETLRLKLSSHGIHHPCGPRKIGRATITRVPAKWQLGSSAGGCSRPAYHNGSQIRFARWRLLQPGSALRWCRPDSLQGFTRCRRSPCGAASGAGTAPGPGGLCPHAYSASGAFCVARAIAIPLPLSNGNLHRGLRQLFSYLRLMLIPTAAFSSGEAFQYPYL